MTEETSSAPEAEENFEFEAAETVGRDLLQALVQELKLLPDVWVKLSQAKQNDVIYRLKERVGRNIATAVHMIAAEGRVVVTGDLDQVTIKDGVKATVKFSGSAPNISHVYEAAGQAVMLIVASAEAHLRGMDEVQGESDQRAMNLGKEYTDKDGDGMPGDVVDAELPADIVAVEHQPLIEELQKAFDDGFDAAEAGDDLDSCPVMAGALCIEWVKGWKEYQEVNKTDWWKQHGAAEEASEK